MPYDLATDISKWVDQYRYKGIIVASRLLEFIVPTRVY